MPPGRSCQGSQPRTTCTTWNPMTTPPVGTWPRSPDYREPLVQGSSQTVRLSPCGSCDRHQNRQLHAVLLSHLCSWCQTSSKPRLRSWARWYLPGWESPGHQIPSPPSFARFWRPHRDHFGPPPQCCHHVVAGPRIAATGQRVTLLSIHPKWHRLRLRRLRPFSSANVKIGWSGGLNQEVVAERCSKMWSEQTQFTKDGGRQKYVEAFRHHAQWW